MAYTLSWWVENEAVLLSLHEEISLEDLTALSEDLLTQFLPAGAAPVHVLLDMTRLEKFPHQLLRIRAAVSNLFLHPALGRLVIVGRANPLATCIVDTLARTFYVDYAQAATMDEAYALTRCYTVL